MDKLIPNTEVETLTPSQQQDIIDGNLNDSALLLILDEYLTGKDIKLIAKEVDCGVNTVYKHLSLEGEIPKTGVSRRMFELITSKGKAILLERSNIIIEKLS